MILISLGDYCIAETKTRRGLLKLTLKSLAALAMSSLLPRCKGNPSLPTGSTEHVEEQLIRSDAEIFVPRSVYSFFRNITDMSVLEGIRTSPQENCLKH